MAEAEVLEAEAPAEEGTPEAPSLVEGVVGAKHKNSLGPELLAQLEALTDEKPADPEVTTELDTTAVEPEDAVDPLPQWVADVRTNIHAITKVPQKKQGQVLEALMQEYTAAANEYGRQMFQQGQDAAKQSAQDEARRTELEAMQEDDPASFIAWQKENPAEAAKFLQGQAPAPADNSRALYASSQALLAKVADSPEIMAKLKANEARYTPTPEGLAALSGDIADYLAETKNPARKQAEQRQQTAERVKDLPKADIAGGGAVEGRLTLEKLKTMSATDIAKYPREQVDAAIRAG